MTHAVATNADPAFATACVISQAMVVTDCTQVSKCLPPRNPNQRHRKSDTRALSGQARKEAIDSTALNLRHQLIVLDAFPSIRLMPRHRWSRPATAP